MYIDEYINPQYTLKLSSQSKEVLIRLMLIKPSGGIANPLSVCAPGPTSKYTL